jgi:hypothetical protein
MIYDFQVACSGFSLHHFYAQFESKYPSLKKVERQLCQQSLCPQKQAVFEVCVTFSGDAGYGRVHLV